eukprot:CAMPEP_0118964932 /NCGR_PEP_ID=MMETSP1173-20130426/2538_1 /TAXON_ID=1034831 /ORGANISM="Rhizochromulina marina cf, Strain CCMP1243" /LENGTH=53 /DNA_ID=CAMNT_0006913455 /DNA_START=45 /DNA_END=202 /DNA_ORIENTATION=+
MSEEQREKQRESDRKRRAAMRAKKAKTRSCSVAIQKPKNDKKVKVKNQTTRCA